MKPSKQHNIAEKSKLVVVCHGNSKPLRNSNSKQFDIDLSPQQVGVRKNFRVRKNFEIVAEEAEEEIAGTEQQIWGRRLMLPLCQQFWTGSENEWLEKGLMPLCKSWLRVRVCCLKVV